MSNSSAHGSVWAERFAELGDAGVWLISPHGWSTDPTEQLQSWLSAAEQVFRARPEVASVFFSADGGEIPLRVFNGAVSDLIGLAPDSDRSRVATALVQQWITRAASKGLLHLPLNAAAAAQGRPAIALGIDAAWLMGGESGAQVFVNEMLKELARRREIGSITLLSDSGGVPRPLDGFSKISGMAWAASTRSGPFLDIMHRPYQPDMSLDYGRYHQVARCVAITVLDFIAYDHGDYHESAWAWRRYQQKFDDAVCQADGVFAISAHVGNRLTRQFAHQLAAPVRSVLLGTNHLTADGSAALRGEVGPSTKPLEHARFLLVLGNDFEHKNRDFAVKVFGEMRERGYDGWLVLAGYHLDAGSSFDHELDGAERYRQHIVRIGAVSAAEKVWLLRRADVVLYPTSNEGFGLVPFEAAALGTPTAFVRFGPLRETMPGVDACTGWQVRPFADHVFRLMANPAAQVDQIRAAGATLTWATTVDHMIAGYQYLLSDDAAWRTRTRRPPTTTDRARARVDGLSQRIANKMRRTFGGASS